MSDDGTATQGSEKSDAAAPARAEWTPPRLERLALTESQATTKFSTGTEHTVYRPS